MDIITLLECLAKKDEAAIEFRLDKITSSVVVTLTEGLQDKVRYGMGSKQICLSVEELSSISCESCFWKDVLNRLDRSVE